MGDAAETRKISLNVIHSPVFYGMASARARICRSVEAEALRRVAAMPGFVSRHAENRREQRKRDR